MHTKAGHTPRSWNAEIAEVVRDVRELAKDGRLGASAELVQQAGWQTNRLEHAQHEL